MSRQRERITIYDVIQVASEQGEWVNGEFEGIVSNPTQGQGNKPSKCKLTDPDSNAEIGLAWFGGDFMKMRGATILVHGDGNKAKLYRGNTEVTIGKNGLVNVVTAATRPASTEMNEKTNAAGNEPPQKESAPPKQAVTPAQMLNRFHATMKRSALLLIHARQYARDIETKEGGPMPAEQFQATVSSLFITAKDRGLLDTVPAPREVKDGKIVPFVPVKDPDAEAKAAAAREAEQAKREAEEKKRAEEERKKREQDELNEDVPF